MVEGYSFVCSIGKHLYLIAFRDPRISPNFLLITLYYETQWTKVVSVLSFPLSVLGYPFLLIRV